jgi:hypothetical protein
MRFGSPVCNPAVRRVYHCSHWMKIRGLSSSTAVLHHLSRSAHRPCSDGGCLPSMPSCDARHDRLITAAGQTAWSGDMSVIQTCDCALISHCRRQDTNSLDQNPPHRATEVGGQLQRFSSSVPIKAINCCFGGQHDEPTTCSRDSEKNTNAVARRLSVCS